MAGSKWAYLQDRFPTLPANPKHREGLAAQMGVYQDLPIAEIAEAYNDLTEEKAEREKELADVDLRLEAALRALHQKMADAKMDGVIAAGYLWTPKLKPYPSVKNKAEFLAWAKEKMPDNLTMHHGTLTSTVCDALEENKPLPPGVDVFLKPSFSRTAQ